MTAAGTGSRFARAMRDLGGAQKAGAGVPAYTRYVNRPLGRRAAAAAFVLGGTANQVTVLSGLVSLASILALVLLPPVWWCGLLAGTGLVLGYVLDSADGQLARLRGGGSLSGEWLDHVVDAARMPAVHLGVLIGLYRFHEDAPAALLLLPLGFLLVSTVRFFALILAEQMRRYAAPGGADGPATGESAARSLIALPGDFGVLCLIFFAWGSLPVFLTLYALLFAGNTLLLVLSLLRRYGELRTMVRA
ncbi:CDP-alcohol phosphatidyltransferase [Amycolatopsis antarctica]|uniref:CDP-alcohol phosphatidyltransferase n=2 Tax=Amycolatopsis antarctica TaxID=1854586 RepID=A0A263CWI8_9PSEU|nr:CDP-alcohol phosphatidyltransferase [Amycolatopsis antarctica]